MKNIFLIVSLLCCHLAGAQKIITPNNYDDEFERIELKAHFAKGENAWENFVQKNLDLILIVQQLPDSVHEFQDSIYVRFQVDKKGMISDFHTTSCKRPGLKKAVLVVLKKSPPWTPALQTVPVKSYVTYLFICWWMADNGGVVVKRAKFPVP